MSVVSPYGRFFSINSFDGGPASWLNVGVNLDEMILPMMAAGHRDQITQIHELPEETRLPSSGSGFNFGAGATGSGLNFGKIFKGVKKGLSVAKSFAPAAANLASDLGHEDLAQTIKAADKYNPATANAKLSKIANTSGRAISTGASVVKGISRKRSKGKGSGGGYGKRRRDF